MNLPQLNQIDESQGNMLNYISEGWAKCPLKTIATRITKGATPTSYGFKYQEKGIRFVKVENLQNGKINHKSIKHFISEQANLNQRRSILMAGDVLFSIAGTIGTTCIVREEDLPANTNQALAIIRGTSDVLFPAFLQLQLKSAIGSRQVTNQARGGSMNNISLGDVGNIQVCVSPLVEQKWIVAKVEQLLARVNAARERLAKLPEILKRFRQSVLAAACSGRLTADWRDQQVNLEQASELLQNLWQRHPEWLSVADSKENELPDIPENWVWAKVGQLGDVTTGNTPSKKEPAHFGGPIPFFKPTDLDLGYKVENSRDTLTNKGARVARVLPPLSVMVTCIGATIGKTGLSRVKGATNQQINSVVTDHNFVSSKFLFWAISSLWAQEQIRLRASETTLPILNKSRFKELPLPLPPFAEQLEIVLRVESLFKVADAIKKRVAVGTAQAEKLTQAILAKAFRGELVPTEAELARREGRSYEPAFTLLAKIEAQRKDVKLQRKHGRSRRWTRNK